MSEVKSSKHIQLDPSDEFRNSNRYLDTINKVKDSLSPVLRYIVESGHIFLDVTDYEEMTACCQLTTSGYRIYVGDKFIEKFTKEEIQALIEHEVAHALRGDCLIPVTMPDIVDSCDPILVGCALDIVINSKPLATDNLNKLATKTGHEISKYPFLKQDHLISWKMVYEELVKNVPVIEIQFDMLPDCQIKDKNKAKKQHIKTILKLRNIKDPELKEKIDQLLSKISMDLIQGSVVGDGGGQKGKIRMPAPIENSLEDLIQRLLNATDVSDSILRKTRGFRREGRIPLLRGTYRVRRSQVLIALDVSGSCYNYWSMLGGIAKSLSSVMDVELILFSTSVEKVEITDTITADNLWGGTTIKPVFEYAENKKPSLLVILTDGEIFDNPPTSTKYPVIWALTPEHDKPTYPKNCHYFILPRVENKNV